MANTKSVSSLLLLKSVAELQAFTNEASRGRSNGADELVLIKEAFQLVSGYGHAHRMNCNNPTWFSSQVLERVFDEFNDCFNEVLMHGEHWLLFCQLLVKRSKNWLLPEVQVVDCQDMKDAYFELCTSAPYPRFIK